MAGVAARFAKQIIKNTDAEDVQGAAGAFTRDSVEVAAQKARARLIEATNEAATKKDAIELARKQREIEQAWKEYDKLPADKQTSEAAAKIVERIQAVESSVPTSGKLAGTSTAADKTYTFPQGLNQEGYKVPGTSDTTVVGEGASQFLPKGVNDAIGFQRNVTKGAYALGGAAALGTGAAALSAALSAGEIKPQPKPIPPGVLPQPPTPPSTPGVQPTEPAKAVAPAVKQLGALTPTQIKGTPNLATAFNELATQIESAPEAVKKQLGYDKSMKIVNDALAELNNSYQQAQEKAQSKAERDQNRAEWASLAGMLAKNIVGYVAAMKGVPADAMAYQTTDWEKRIANINNKLALDMGNLKDKFKLDAETKMREKEALDKTYGETLKSKLESLRTIAEGKSAQAKALEQRALQQAGIDWQAKEATYRGEQATQALEAAATRQAEELASKERIAAAALESREDIAAQRVAAAGKAKKDALNKQITQAFGLAATPKDMEKGLGQLRSIASQLGKSPVVVDAIIEKYKSWNDIGKLNEVSPKAQAEISQYLMEDTSSSSMDGQQVVPMVQSQPDTPLDVFNQLPSGSEYWYKGKKLRKP